MVNNKMDPDKWEDCNPSDSSGVMISNLPLLFVNGSPTALKLMSVGDFEKFIPFMVRCSTGESSSVPWSQLPRPPWWPTRLPFRIPSSNASSDKTLMNRIVERCYSYHGCPYLLQFCSSLVDVMPSCGYRFTDNRDGTSSMYHGTTGKLLVAFRNENRDYDKIPDPAKPTQKKLISSIHHGKEKRNVMVQPPISDVYLCDKCDDEFLSLKDVQVHEKQCKGNSLLMDMPSPEPEIFEDVMWADEQVPFLSQLGLQPAKNSGLQPYTSPVKKQRLPVKTVSYNHFHFDSVDVSSPFGKQILARLRNYGKLEFAQHNVMRYERYIFAPLDDYERSKTRHSNRWIVTYRRKRKTRGWNHLFCFTKEQKDERRRTIASGLNYRSRCLLPKCKPIVIKLKRLKPADIDHWIKPARIEPSITLIDLVDMNGFPPPADSPTNRNGSIMKNHMEDPLKLNDAPTLSDSVRNILSCKSVTVTKIYRSSNAGRPSEGAEAVNGTGCSNSKHISSYNHQNSAIEVIDLLSSDEELPSNGICSQLKGTNSKNGCSHWSPKKSLELGRSPGDLINGSPPNCSCISSQIDESLLSSDKITESVCDPIKGFPADGKQIKGLNGPTQPKNTYSPSDDDFNSHLDDKAAKRQRRELLRLKSDECRELNHRGLDLLRDFNGCGKNILTRRLAKWKLPTLTTRNSQFVIRPLLKKQPLIGSLHSQDKLKLPKKFSKDASLDENGNSKTCPKSDQSRFEKKKEVTGIKRTASHSFGRNVVKRPRLVRELLSLSQDECKEIRCKGFHPADVIRVVNGMQCRDPGRAINLHSVLLNKPSSYYLSTKKLYSKLNLLAIDEGIRDTNLLSDVSETRSIEKDNIYRQLYLLKGSHVQDLVNWRLGSNSRPHTMPSPRTETPRRTHRQLIRSQSGMCVLSYHLPQFR